MMICSFRAVHSPSGGGLGLVVSKFSGADRFFECLRLGLLVASDSGKGGLNGGGGIEWCLDEIHESSGKGFNTDLDGWCCTPLGTPAEL
jgi:hypothetical protein